MFDKPEGLGIRSELGRERKEGSEEIMQIYISPVFLIRSIMTIVYESQCNHSQYAVCFGCFRDS